MLREWCVFNVLNAFLASRVQVFDMSIPTAVWAWGVLVFVVSLPYVWRAIFPPPDGSAPAALASLLLDPPEPQNIGKTQCFVTFTFSRTPASFFF